MAKFPHFATALSGIVTLLMLSQGGFSPAIATHSPLEAFPLPEDPLKSKLPKPPEVDDDFDDLTKTIQPPNITVGAKQLSTEPIYPDRPPTDWLVQHNHTTDDSEDWPEPIHDDQLYWSVLVDQLEYRVNDSHNLLYWDLHGWIGGDYQRFWVKSEGDVDLDSGNGEAELQVLYSRLFSPYWQWQAGLRYDQLYGETDRGRAFAVLGIEGLAPYFFEVDAALFVSQEGDISARVKAEYELLLTQKLVLQPKVEVNAAIQRVDEFGVGSGINDLDLGLRLRYEVNRQFAPYIGVNWTKKFGETADFAVEEGEATDEISAVAGLRLLF